MFDPSGSGEGGKATGELGPVEANADGVGAAGKSVALKSEQFMAISFLSLLSQMMIGLPLTCGGRARLHLKVLDFEISTADVTLTGPHSIIGRSLVIS